VQIQVLLDPQAPSYGTIQTDLLNELNALGTEKGVKITTLKEIPPVGTLSVTEVFKFIIDHKEEIVTVAAMATAVLELINAVLQRHKLEKEKDQKPLIMIIIENRCLPLPTSAERQRKFLAQLAKKVTFHATTDKDKAAKARSAVRFFKNKTR